MAKKKPTKTTIKWSAVINKNTDQLIKLSPENPTFRAQVQSEIKVALPDEAQTYEQIVEWVEANVSQVLNYDPEEAAESAQQYIRGSRSGTCSFTQSLSAYTDVPITVGDIVAAARKAVGTNRSGDYSRDMRRGMQEVVEAKIEKLITGKSWTELVREQGLSVNSGDFEPDGDVMDEEFATPYLDDDDSVRIRDAWWQALKDADETLYNRLVNGAF